MTRAETRCVYVVQWTHSTGRIAEWFFPTHDEAVRAADRIRRHRKSPAITVRWF